MGDGTRGYWLLTKVMNNLACNKAFYLSTEQQ